VGVEENEISIKANGGTELVSRALAKRLKPELADQVQIIPSRVDLHTLDPNKIRILHCHDLVEGQNQSLANRGWQRFHKIVFVSNWQMQNFINAYRIPWDKCCVIQNAIEPLEFHTRQEGDDVVRLIYHSTPHRGLDILAAVFEKLATEDEKIELDVYSSFKLYGWDKQDEDPRFQEIFNKLKEIPRVNYHGAVSNEEVRKAVSRADIFAYPNTWQETSCLCLIEAMSAGLFCIHPNYGALFETAANWTTMYQYNEDQNHQASIMYGLLKSFIPIVRENRADIANRLNNQAQYTNIFYNWDRRIKEWEGLIQALMNEPREITNPEDMFVYEVR
jgi:UDP-glucose:(glucosyl)LPS alpha-1,2-glucosyltransferase